MSNASAWLASMRASAVGAGAAAAGAEAAAGVEAMDVSGAAVWAQADSRLRAASAR